MYRPIQVLLRHWQPVVALNLVIMVVAIVGMANVKKAWTARAQLILPNAAPALNASWGTLGDVKGGEGLVFTQQVDTREILSKILLSNATLDPVLAADPEQDAYGDLKAFRELFEVKPSATSTTIALAAEAATSALAQQRLEQLIASFQRQLIALRQRNAEERSALLQQELAEAEKKLRSAERQLLRFQTVTRLADGATQTAELVRSINTLNTAQAQLQARLSAAQAKVVSLSAQLGQTPEQALGALRIQADGVYQANRQRLAELETELSRARIRFQEDHPLITSLREEQAELLATVTQLEAPLQATGELGLDNVLNNNPVANLAEQLVSTQAEVATLQRQTEEMQRQIDQFNAEFDRIPAAQAKLRELQRQYNIAEGLYTGLNAQLKAAKGDTFSSYPNVQVLDVPRVDAKPSGPGRRVVAMGAVLASLLGSAAIVLLREGQNPLLSPEDIRELEVPILGRIPILQAVTGSQPLHQPLNQPSKQWRTSHPSGWGGVLALSGNGVAEQPYVAAARGEFQRSASALSRRAIARGRLLITSATPGEGKTTVAFGLASALSNLGFRVLLVDANLQNRSLSIQLGCGTPSQEKTGIPVRIASRLDFLPLVVEAAALGQFLAQQGFERELNALQNERRYDYVLVDASSVSTSSELSLMLAIIPNLLLVILPGRSLRKPFVESLDRLGQYGATIQGLVLNGVDGSESDQGSVMSAGQSEGVVATV